MSWTSIKPAICLLLNIAFNTQAEECSLERVSNEWQAQIQSSDGSQALQKLTQTLADRAALYSGNFTLLPIQRILSEPLNLALYRELLAAPEGGANLSRLIEQSLTRFHAWSPPLDNGLSQARPPSPPIDLMTALKQSLAEAAQGVSQAFADIDPADLDALRQAIPALLRQLTQDNQLADDEQTALLFNVAGKLDFQHLAQAFGRLLEVGELTLSARVRERLSVLEPIARPAWLAPGFQGAFLAAEQTPNGLILIGAAGDNLYAGNAAFILDLGGDDTYTLNPHPQTAAIIDLAGNDRYLAPGLGTTGAALAGVSLLMDRRGDDTYVGGSLTQGSGLLGFGALIDLQGDDLYAAQELAQGAALFGMGMLIDGGGNDTYSASKFAQGFGGTFGYGLLIEQSGDEHYLAGGKQASSYATPGRFQTFSQGVGMGIRGLAPGGIGVLQDNAGDDHYVGANFAQGVGYFLGIGLLEDRAGDDLYTGSRYAQGAAAHLGAGLLIERQGDDRYWGHIAAHAGGAWDLSIAGLIDCAGNDRYHTGDLSLGAGEQNAIGFFHEHAGSDQYQAPAKAFGYSGRTDYADGRNAPNAGFFLDRGATADLYQTPATAADNLHTTRKPVSVFQDR